MVNNSEPNLDVKCHEQIYINIVKCLSENVIGGISRQVTLIRHL